jgi:two-component system, chemotaxis family, sensor kinase CheA
MSTDILEQMRVAFRAEALDLLVELDSALLALEAEPGDSKLVNRVFRAIHTIKGSGATAGFHHLAGFAHNIEETFDLAREGRMAVTPELIDCGLKACDVIRQILEQKTEAGPVPGESEVGGAFARLLPASGRPPAEPIEAPAPAAKPRSAYQVVVKPKPEIFYSGTDPVTLLDDLRELGQAHVTAHADRVPLLASLEAEHCYLWWEVLLVTGCDPAAIREVFVFVEDECDVRVRLLEDQSDSVALLGSISAESFGLFRMECEDHLERMEMDALSLEGAPASRNLLDSLFRSVHSIKGNSGVLLGQISGDALPASHPLELLKRVAHALESVLDPFRAANAGPVPDETIQTTLETCDAIRTLLGCLIHNGAGGPVSPELLSRLGVSFDASQAAGSDDGRAAAFLNTTSQCMEMISGCLRGMGDEGAPAGPALETYLRGVRTLSAAAHYRNCPDLEEPLAQQLRILDVAVKTGAGLSRLERTALDSAFEATRSCLDRLLSQPGRPAPEPARAAPPAAKAPADRTGAPAASSTIRIDQDKLDRLMRVVGELLVARGAFPLLAGRLNAGADRVGVAKELRETGGNISRIADELQASVMSIRMLPVKTVFQRFPRLVRDLARSLGKEIRLVVEGEGIELDKTIIEQIGDPLVHVIRNAVDHGIEPPQDRRAKGKDPSGQLTLRAAHEAGGVVIEIADDGRGLDAAALKRKAVDKGLLAPEAAAAMSEDAAFQLVFLPGLTTAAKVTDVSGRGVGMDVVRSNVRNLQGTVEIRSRRGQGTAFRIKLPTSLMISKGILLEAGSEEYILPLSSIRDMVKLPPEEAHEYCGLTLARVRGTTYPIFGLADMLGLARAATPELSVAIVEAGSVKYGLLVDKFLSEVEVLVKPLASGLEQCKEFQGAAIMGDGRVVLVLNVLECHSLGRSACV